MRCLIPVLLSCLAMTAVTFAAEPLKKGDRVLTTGGIYGTVQGVEAEVVYLKIADNVKIKLARSAITGIVAGDSEP